MRGVGRAMFVATLLLIVGTRNIIYGIGALDDANVLVNDHRLVLTNLNTLGWVSIGGSYPWWSLCIFFLCIYIVHGIFIFDRRAVA